MSKTDTAAKADTKADDKTEAKTSPQAADTQPQAAPAPKRDKHTGTGGHYEIRNGQRVLVERTKRD